MPLWDYVCPNKHTTEQLHKMDAEPKIIACHCGLTATKKIALYARTPGRFGDNGLGGSSVNGVYDRGLGATYHNSMERDRLIEQRGVVPLSDLGGGDHLIDDWIDKRKAEDRATDAYNTTFDKAYGETKDILVAHEQAVQAKETV